jgi:cytoskeletal protein RodZ
MKKGLIYLLVLGFILGLSGLAMAGTATQTVTIVVSAINAISVSGPPGTLTVNAATAGSQPTPVSDNTTTYNITTNAVSGSPVKITGVLSAALPTGLTLTINLAAPSTGTSLGAVALSATPASLVTGIYQDINSSLMITYTASATVAAPIGTTSETVTLTLG